MKSLLNNPNLHVITYKRPTKSKRGQIHVEQDKKSIYYREIGIDKTEGPYCYPGSSKYRIDTTYYDYPDIYSVFLQGLLDAKDMSLFKVHEYINYHQKTFGAKFVKYWQSVCSLLPLKAPLGAVIFVDKKYFLISWIPDIAYRYAYPGYEKEVAICGGKQVDIGLNTIPNKLKLNNYGEPFKFKYKFVDFVWHDVLEQRLKDCTVNFNSSGCKKKWRVSPADAHFIFEWPWQNQKYFERHFENGETMFISDMEISFSLKSYYLHINGIQLKKDSEGYIFGLERLEDDQYGIYSILLDLDSKIINHIFDYVSIYDLITIKGVCKELKETCSNKVQSLYSTLLRLPPEIQFYLLDYVGITDLHGIILVCPKLQQLCSSKLKCEQFPKFQSELLIQSE